MVKTADGFEGFVLSYAQIFVSYLLQRYGEQLGVVSTFVTAYFVFGVPLAHVFLQAPMWYILAVFTPLQFSPWMMFIVNNRTVALLKTMIPYSVVTPISIAISAVFSKQTRLYQFLTAFYYLVNAFLSVFAQAYPFALYSPLSIQDMWPVKTFDDAFAIRSWKTVNSFDTFSRCTAYVVFVHQVYIWLAAAGIMLVKAGCSHGASKPKTELQKALKEKTD